MKRLSVITLLVLASFTIFAQGMRLVPELSPAGGEYEDQVRVSVSWPEGCSGAVYYAEGCELLAVPYEDTLTLTRSTRLSVAGVDETGRIITDAVTATYSIRHVSRPQAVPTPAEGERMESFYVTRVDWANAQSVTMDLSAFKSGNSRYGEPVVWLTDKWGNTISRGDYNNAWPSGMNAFKFYLYKNYNQPEGNYRLHIAGGIFVVDGQRYEDELSFSYSIVSPVLQPVFTPESGEYTAPLMVSVRYPQDGSATYKMYSIDGDVAQYYQGPIRLTHSATIEAWGVDDFGEDETAHTSATYTLLPPDPGYQPMAAPVLERRGDLLYMTSEEGGVIKFWFDHRMSTAALYTEPVALTHNTVISCLAYTPTHRSEVVRYEVTDLPLDRGDKGDIVLLTAADLEELHLTALSENGRYAAGYVGVGTSSRGIIWDLRSDIMTYPQRAYIGQFSSISNDGVAYGWRTATVDVDEQTGDNDLLWGMCSNGVWTPAPQGMDVSGITGDGRLRGWIGSEAVFYDPETQSYSADTLMQRLGQGTILSANGEWAILSQYRRLHVPTMEVSAIGTTNYLYPDSPRPEVLQCIANDGTIFGTYDPTSLSPDRGTAVVYTTDGRWRRLADWLRDGDGYLPVLDGFDLTSVRGCTGDGKQLLLHVFPRDVASIETFTRGLCLMLDVQVRSLPPVDIHAVQMPGQLSVKLTWQIPLLTSSAVCGYRVYRNDTLVAELPANRYELVDSDIQADADYCYSVQAVYADMTESQLSDAVCVRCVLSDHLPVQGLRARPEGLSDLLLSWESPASSIPRMQYFNDDNGFYAFGVSGYDSEWAIRLPQSDLVPFVGDSIRTFHVLPTGRQRSYELRLYAGSSRGTYDTTPFYRQSISPDSLQFGTVNTVLLRTPQAVPDSVDLYVALYVESADNYDVLGVQYEGFRAGYTDLCRVVGVHSRFVSIADESSVSTEVVLPLGIGICSREQLATGVVSHYLLTDDDRLLSTTKSVRALLRQVAPGEHRLGVTAVYPDGVHSDTVTLDYLMTLNEEAYLPVEDVHVQPLPEQSVRLSWSAPLDEARTMLHWGSLTPTPGLPMPANLTSFSAGAIYPATLTSDYADGFEIVAAYFYPTATGHFSLTLDDSNAEDGDLLASVIIPSVQPDTFNYVWFKQPIVLSPSVSYRLMVTVSGTRSGVAPLAYDDAGSWTDGYSNLFAYDIFQTTLADIVQIEEHPNWLLGLVIRRSNAPELPLVGYTLSLDGDTQERLITQPQAELTGLPLGEHTARVDVVYTDAVTVEGRAIPFTITVDQALHDATGEGAEATRYDLLGRPAYAPVRGQVYICGQQKYIQH